MLQHYVLTLDPEAAYDWGRCTLRHPLSSDHPALATLVSQQVNATAGQFLVAVELKVQVLEAVALPPVEPRLLAPVTETAHAPADDSDATESVPAL